MKLRAFFSNLKLSSQVVTILMIFAVPVSVIFAFISYMDQKKHYFSTMESHAFINMQTTIMLVDKYLLIDDFSQTVNSVLAVLHSSPSISYVYLEKDDGSLILYISKEKWEIVQSLPKEIQKMQQNQNGERSFGLLNVDLQELETKAFSHAIMPILISGFKWGNIHAGFDASEYILSVKKLLSTTLLFVLVFLFFVFLVSLMVGRFVSNPILDLTDLTKKVSSGDLEVKSDVRGSKEVGILSSNFNKMVTQIKEAREKLNNANLVLEERVNQRTKELEELNANLDLRIKEEVQKRHEQEDLLVHQSRLAAMGEMIGNIAHQWRQPLNALGLTIQNLQTAYEHDYLNGEYIDRTIKKSQRLTAQMSSTIDDFRDFFKPESAKEFFNLKKSILQSFEIVEASFSSNNIQVDIDVAESIEIFGYPSQFSQVVLNFLNNAKDALLEKNQDNKKIHIEAKIKDNFTIIDFKDNGGGIPEGIMEKVFEPYFTTKDQGQGSGIGLYMSKMIVEKNMKGTLMVSNSDIGAVFSIKLETKNQTDKNDA